MNAVTVLATFFVPRASAEATMLFNGTARMSLLFGATSVCENALQIMLPSLAKQVTRIKVPTAIAGMSFFFLMVIVVLIL